MIRQSVVATGSSSQDCQRNGLSVMELLVTITILLILTGLVVAAIQRVRESASRAQCLNNLKQIGLALHLHEDAMRKIPPGVSFLKGKDPHPHMSWNTRILPFLDHRGLWEQALRAFEAERFFLMPPHAPVAGTCIPYFMCPSDDRVFTVAKVRVQSLRGRTPFEIAFTSYVGCEGTNQASRDGVLFLDSEIKLTDIMDGLSNTIMVAERPPSANLDFGWWYAGWGQSQDGSAEMNLGVRERIVHRRFAGCPQDSTVYRPGLTSNQCDALHFWSLHPGGAHFLFCDGSVRFLIYSAEPVLPGLATRAGGEVVPE